ERGAGEIVKSHAKLSGAGVGGIDGTLSRWKSYTNGRHLPNVTTVTEKAPIFPFNGPGKYRLRIKFSYRNNSLIGIDVPPCCGGECGLRVCLLRRRKLSAIRRHQPGQPLKPKSDWRDY